MDHTLRVTRESALFLRIAERMKHETYCLERAEADELEKFGKYYVRDLLSGKVVHTNVDIVAFASRMKLLLPGEQMIPDME